MFLSKFFSNARAKVMAALAGLTMIFGVGAGFATGISTTYGSAVETNAEMQERPDDTTKIRIQDYNNGGFYSIHVWDLTYLTGTNGHAYTESDFENYYVKQVYVTSKSKANCIGSKNLSYHKLSSNNFYLNNNGHQSGSGNFNYYVFPWWVNTFKYKIVCSNEKEYSDNRTGYWNGLDWEGFEDTTARGNQYEYSFGDKWSRTAVTGGQKHTVKTYGITLEAYWSADRSANASSVFYQGEWDYITTSDINTLLSANRFSVSGWYSNTSLDASWSGGHFSDDTGVLYALVVPSFTTIANDKVRIWFTYYNSRNSEEKYFDSDNAVMKVWTHKNPDNAAAGESVYASYSIYNNQSDSRRYDYFDINLSDCTNGWYLTLQRFSSGGDYWSGTDNGTYKFQLTSDKAGKVFSINCTSDTWWIGDEAVTSPDTELAVLALCGLHTCSSSPFNGYKTYTNYNATFVKNEGSWKINDSYYDELANYYIYDFAPGDKTYAGSVETKINAYDKYIGIGNMSSTNGKSILGSLFIPTGSNSTDSPLTTTLWIVLVSGLAGLAAIGTAYFVSKKKRHQA